METITCGGECGHCKPADRKWYHVAPCGDEYDRSRIGGQYRPAFATLLVVKHCPKTGAALGFAADGSPTVGETYAEVERKAAALDKLEAYLRRTEEYLCVGHDMAEAGIAGLHGEWYMKHSAPDLLALAESLPEGDG